MDEDCGICRGNPKACDVHDCGDAHKKGDDLANERGIAEPVAQLRHLYANMVNGAVRDTASAKRIATGLLGPVIEQLEAAPPAAQKAHPDSAQPVELTKDEIDKLLERQQGNMSARWILNYTRDVERAVLAKNGLGGKQ